MKHCPKCNCSFPNTDEFCEVDGTTLVGNNAGRKALLTVAVAIGTMALGVVLFVVYQRLTNETVAQSATQSSSNQPFTQQVVSPPPPLLPLPSVSPTPSPSPSPSPTPTPTPTVKVEPAKVALSTGPVATNVDAARGPVTIRLMDGSTVKADEVWETGEGIWYRRRGLVTLLKRDQVKALETPPPPKPSPTASPAPASSPVPSK